MSAYTSSKFPNMPSKTYDIIVGMLQRALCRYENHVQWVINEDDPIAVTLVTVYHRIDLSKIDLTKKIIVFQIPDQIKPLL